MSRYSLFVLKVPLKHGTFGFIWVRMDPEYTIEKSLNLKIKFFRPGKSWKKFLVVENLETGCCTPSILP